MWGGILLNRCLSLPSTIKMRLWMISLLTSQFLNKEHQVPVNYVISLVRYHFNILCNILLLLIKIYLKGLTKFFKVGELFLNWIVKLRGLNRPTDSIFKYVSHSSCEIESNDVLSRCVSKHSCLIRTSIKRVMMHYSFVYMTSLSIRILLL